MHLQIEEFHFQRFSLQYHPGNLHAYQDDVDIGRLHFDYDVLHNPDEPTKWALAMTFYLAPENDDDIPCYELEAQLFGFFDATGINHDAVEYVVRFNGMLTLYGILRGQAAIASGVFPMGKLTLPSIDMAGVVQAVETAKQEEFEEAAREERKPKPKPKPKPKKKATAKSKPAAKKKSTPKKKAITKKKTSAKTRGASKKKS